MANLAKDSGVVENSSSLPTNGSQNDSCIHHNKMCIPDEDYLAMLTDHSFPSASEWVFIVLYIVVFFAGLVGNGLVCYSVWRNHHMRTVTNVFIVNLAIADFLVILVCLPPTLLADTTETWYVTGYTGHITCKLVLYLQTVSVSVSVLTLSAISLERWYAICHPLKFMSTLRRARIIIGIIWTIAMASAVPELVVVQLFHTFAWPPLTNLLTYCKMGWHEDDQKVYQIFQMLVFYFLPIGLMGFCYFQIALCLWKNTIPGSAESQKMTGDGKNNTEPQLVSRRKAAKMLISVVIMFALCFLPVYLYNILKYAGVLHGADPDTIPLLALVAHWLCYFNSAINPIIYNFMSAKFRKEFQVACSCCFRVCRGRRVRSDETSYNYKYSTQFSHVSQTEQLTLSTVGTTHT